MKEKLERITELNNELIKLYEHSRRLSDINEYDHSAKSNRPFSIEFSGGSCGTILYVNSNEIGDEITDFFTNMWKRRIEEIEGELETLIK